VKEVNIISKRNDQNVQNREEECGDLMDKKGHKVEQSLLDKSSDP